MKGPRMVTDVRQIYRCTHLSSGLGHCAGTSPALTAIPSAYLYRETGPTAW